MPRDVWQGMGLNPARLEPGGGMARGDRFHHIGRRAVRPPVRVEIEPAAGRVIVWRRDPVIDASRLFSRSLPGGAASGNRVRMVDRREQPRPNIASLLGARGGREPWPGSFGQDRRMPPSEPTGD